MRSRNLRVILDSASNSLSMACAIDIRCSFEKMGWISLRYGMVRKALLTALFLRGCANLVQHLPPALAHIFLQSRLDETERPVGELQQGPVGLFDKAVLH